MKIRIILILIILTSTMGCEKIKKLTQFNLKYSTSITIPSAAGTGLPVDIETPDVEANTETTFSLNNTTENLVEQISLKKMSLNLSSPEDGDLSFLKSVIIYMSADSLPDIKVAWNEDVTSDTGKTITMETANDDLKEYIFKDSFKLKISTVTNKTLAKDHLIDIDMVFFVDAKILGL